MSSAIRRGSHRVSPRDRMEERAGDIAAPPAGQPERIALAVGELGQRLVRARLDHLRVVEFMAAHHRARRPERRPAVSVACR